MTAGRVNASTEDVVARMFLDILRFDEFPPALPASERPLVVVVDDEPIVRRSLERMFRRYPCDVVGAAHGIQLIKLLRDRAPDLIVMDVNMPYLNGIDLCSAMSRSVALQHIPVVVFSGYLHGLTTTQALESGACALFEKPNGTEFAAAVWDILQVRRR